HELPELAPVPRRLAGIRLARAVQDVEDRPERGTGGLDPVPRGPVRQRVGAGRAVGTRTPRTRPPRAEQLSGRSGVRMHLRRHGRARRPRPDRDVADHVGERLSPRRHELPALEADGGEAHQRCWPRRSRDMATAARQRHRVLPTGHHRHLAVTTDVSAAERLVRGAVDLYNHANPHLLPRPFNDIRMARVAQAAGLSAVVHRHHYVASDDRAAIASDETGFCVLGAIELGDAVGMNPWAVELSLDGGACWVSLPSLSAASFRPGLAAMTS